MVNAHMNQDSDDDDDGAELVVDQAVDTAETASSAAPAEKGHPSDETVSRVPPQGADVHETKKDPATVGLGTPRISGRFLRKAPIAGLMMAGLVGALVMSWNGLTEKAGNSFASTSRQPIEPQVPTAPNLEVSDIVKNAPGNSSPVLVPRLKAPPASPPTSAGATPPPIAGPTGRPPDSRIPNLGDPAQAQGGAQSDANASQAAAARLQSRQAWREARRAELERARASDVFSAGETVEQQQPGVPQEAPSGLQPPQGPGRQSSAIAGSSYPQIGGQGILGAAGASADETGQAQKSAFLSNRTPGTRAEGGYQVTVQPENAFRMRAGWVIPCGLQGQVNSDLPGMVVARVTENVYDSVDGSHLLVPQGATVSGPVNSSVAYGQERGQFCWTLLERDDGVSIDLGCSPAYDRSGASGVAGEVDNHYGRLVTGVVLTALLGATTQAVTGDMQNYRPTVAQGFAIGAASEFGSAGQQITRKNLNIQPTITVKAATQVVVLLEKPVVMPPYKQPVRP